MGRQVLDGAKDRIWIACLVLAVAGVAGALGFIGADARWLAALGNLIVHRGAVPAGVPFAATSSVHWTNPLVLAELIFAGVQTIGGDRALMMLQMLAVAAAVVTLCIDGRERGGSRSAVTGAVALAALGIAPELAVARVQLFSIALFPLAALLLRREADAPSARIWLMVPLLALWTNLHGAALTGLVMTLAYLWLFRARRDPRTAIAVSLAAMAAVVATPAGVHTVTYYHGLLTSEAATRGAGLWAPLSLRAPLDVLLVAVAVLLGYRLRHRRLRAWEVAMIAGLAVMTVNTGRAGVWLVLFIAPLAATGSSEGRRWRLFLPVIGCFGAVLAVLAVARGPHASGASPTQISRVLAAAHGTPVLAEDVIAEQVALDGGRVWIANPLDAFSRRAQARYLNWSDGRLAAVPDAVEVVVTRPGDRAERQMRRQSAFRLLSADRTAAVFVRRS